MVTGAAGFIGFHTSKRLLDRGDEVIGMDNLNDYYDVSFKEARLVQLVETPGFSFHKLDISDREGVATVGFVLHPDGTIKNARLVSSSSTGMLDRAALSAVKRIEPFRAAQDYLDQAEEFKIDVVFNLL